MSCVFVVVVCFVFVIRWGPEATYAWAEQTHISTKDYIGLLALLVGADGCCFCCCCCCTALQCRICDLRVFDCRALSRSHQKSTGGYPYSADDELFRLQAQNENLKLCLLCLVRLSFGSVDVALQIVGRRVVNRVNFKFLLLSLHYTLLILFAGQPPDENNILCDSSSTPLLPHMQRAYSDRARSAQLFAYPITIHFRLLFT